eukprot:6653931-Alexandrium_andersonii.AAC.1
MSSVVLAHLSCRKPLCKRRHTWQAGRHNRTEGHRSAPEQARAYMPAQAHGRVRTRKRSAHARKAGRHSEGGMRAHAHAEA